MSELPIARALLLLPFILATACSSGDNATSQSGSGGGSGTGTSAGAGGAGGAGAGGADGGGGGGGGTGGGSADPCEKPWPSATSTGIPDGTPQLTALNDDFHTEQDGQVFDAVELNGRLYIDHKNITIRRSRLVGDQYYAVYATDTADGLTIEDCDIEGGLLLPNNSTVRRSHAHAGAGGSRADGFIFAASNVLLEDNLIDGLAGGDGAHVDGIQDMGGTGIVIRHNWIDPSSPPINNGGVNAALFVSPEFGNPSSDVTVECNMLLGGGSWYPLRIYNTTGTVVVVGNRFDRNFMGVPVHLVETTITTWGDNAYADNGEEIPPP